VDAEVDAEVDAAVDADVDAVAVGGSTERRERSVAICCCSDAHASRYFVCHWVFAVAIAAACSVESRACAAAASVRKVAH
jgi:hypothetical protein